MTTALPLREQMKALESLQEIDIKITQLKKKKEALPVALKTFDESFNRAKSAVDTKKLQLVELDKAERQSRAAIELNNDRLARANGKLEGVQNGQEFQAANKEIDQLKRLNLTLEEQIKKSAVDTENEKKALGDLESKLQELQNQREAQVAQMGTETGQLDRDITSLEGARNEFLSRVEKRILTQYDRVRNARAGLGMVPAVSGRCSGCNMVIAPQLYNQIQRGIEVHACPSCHRILFVPGDSAQA